MLVPRPGTQAGVELMANRESMIQAGVDLYDATMQPAPAPIPEPAVLSQADQDSALWSKIRGALELMLTNYRIQNDSDLTELETAAIRGRIKQVKEFLALGENPVLDEDSGFPDLGY